MALKHRKLIKELNKIEFLGLKGIKVGDVLAIDIWAMDVWTDIKLHHFLSLQRTAFLVNKSGVAPKIACVCTTSPERRKDQVVKFEAVTELLENNVVIVPTEAKGKRNPYIFLIPFWYMQLAKLHYSSTVKKGICYRLCEAVGNANSIVKSIAKLPTIKKVLCFFDVAKIDNVLVQKCNQLGLRTYTLQHGIINGYYDYIEYTCSYAQKFLAWGEYTKRMAMHYGMPEQRIEVVGNVNALIEERECRKEIPECKRFLVCGNGVLNKDDWKKNCALIEMANHLAKEQGLTYYLKVHPYDDVNKYRHYVDNKFCKDICAKTVMLPEVLDKVDFMLCGNSTTFCDAIYEGVPAFRYIPEHSRAIDCCKGIGFGRIDDYQTLKSAYEDMNKDKEKYYKQLMRVRQFLFKAGDVSINYKRVIEAE